jgi:hypothetical protein
VLLNQLHEAVCCCLRLRCPAALHLHQAARAGAAVHAAAAPAAHPVLEVRPSLLLLLLLLDGPQLLPGLLAVLGRLQDSSEGVAHTKPGLEAEG